MFTGLTIMSKGCKPVELTKEETSMIKKINGYRRKAVIYFLAVVCFGFGAIALLFEDDIDIVHFIFFVLLALIFAKIFYSHIHQKIEYAYYGTVTKKEVRYGMSDRFTPTVTDYSKTVPQKTKEQC